MSPFLLIMVMNDLHIVMEDVVSHRLFWVQVLVIMGWCCLICSMYMTPCLWVSGIKTM